MNIGNNVMIVTPGCRNQGLIGRVVDILTAEQVCVEFEDETQTVYHLANVSIVPDLVDTKDTNPKDAVGLSKAALSVLPMPPLYEAALAMAEGAMKYGRHNYRAASVRYSVYFDAIQRHLALWYEGQDNAPDSGCHHLGHVMACCIILLDDILGNQAGNDDRPPVNHNERWLSEFNRRMKVLLERYPNPEPPCTNL